MAKTKAPEPIPFNPATGLDIEIQNGETYVADLKARKSRLIGIWDQINDWPQDDLEALFQVLYERLGKQEQYEE